ncbi:hypothetical protein C8Q77DRAFT_98102 [Trametes polyzona]|nr:hypothetical protein C8Q77DRAFT_98102 [Trametes polyzona]
MLPRVSRVSVSTTTRAAIARHLDVQASSMKTRSTDRRSHHRLAVSCNGRSPTGHAWVHVCHATRLLAFSQKRDSPSLSRRSSLQGRYRDHLQATSTSYSSSPRRQQRVGVREMAFQSSLSPTRRRARQVPIYGSRARDGRSKSHFGRRQASDPFAPEACSAARRTVHQLLLSAASFSCLASNLNLELWPSTLPTARTWTLARKTR